MCNFYLMQTSFLLIFPFLITIFPSIRYFSAALCFPDSLLISLYWLPQPSCSPCSFPREYTQFAYLKTRLPPTTASSSLILSLQWSCLQIHNFTTLFPWTTFPSKLPSPKSIPQRFISTFTCQVVLLSSLQRLSALGFHSTISFRSSLWMSTEVSIVPVVLELHRSFTRPLLVSFFPLLFFGLVG